jgi:hypothetical protein
MRAKLLNDLAALAVVLVIGALGFGVRFLMVHVPPGFDRSPGMCQLHTDFWNGDRFLC